MSTSDWLAGLSMVNAGLQCTNQYLSDKKEDNPYALNKFFFNLSGATARIGMADYMARHGNYWGYTMNSFIPYTDTRANLFAMSSPFMMPGFFGRMPFMPYGGGFFGCHPHHHCHGGNSSTFISIRC